MVMLEIQEKTAVKKEKNNIPNEIIYNLIIQQITNLVSDLRVVFPRDIVLKVIKDNLPCLLKNKIEAIQYLKNNISQSIKVLIQKRDESLFDEDNKSIKNIKFRRSEFVFNKLRNNWKQLDEKNKIIVWKYLNFILTLLEKI